MQPGYKQQAQNIKYEEAVCVQNLITLEVNIKDFTLV